jgi:hypothetical protein
MLDGARGKPSRTVTLCLLLWVAALLLLDHGTLAMPEHRWPVRDPESRLHDVLSVPDNPQLILQQLGGVPEIDWDSITDPSGTIVQSFTSVTSICSFLPHRIFSAQSFLTRWDKGQLVSICGTASTRHLLICSIPHVG